MRTEMNKVRRALPNISAETFHVTHRFVIRFEKQMSGWWSIATMTD